EKIGRPNNPVADAEQDKPESQQYREVSRRSWFGGSAPRRQRNVAAQPVHHERGHEREESQRDQRAQHARYHREAKQVERDVATEYGIGAAERDAIETLQQCEPPR